MLIFGKKILAAMALFVLGAFTSSYMMPTGGLEAETMTAVPIDSEEEDRDKNSPKKTPIVNRNDSGNGHDHQQDDNERDPKECLKNINKRQKDIAKELKKIKEMLKDKKIAKHMKDRRQRR